MLDVSKMEVILMILVLTINSAFGIKVTDEDINKSLEMLDANMHHIMEDIDASFEGQDVHLLQVSDEFKEFNTGFNFIHNTIHAIMKEEPEIPKEENPENQERPDSANQKLLVAGVTIIIILTFMLGTFGILAWHISRFKGDISMMLLEEGILYEKVHRD